VRTADAGDNIRPAHGRLFWALAVVGWAVIAIGVAGLLRNGARTQPPALARWLVGSAVVHDALIAPVVFGVGLLLARFAPARIRPFLQAGLVITGMLALATFPFVAGFGKSAGNPSALPGSYGPGLLVVLGAVWLGVAALAARSLLLRRGRR
jgi:hypothetical protein